MNTKTRTPIDNSAFGPPQGAVERAVIHAGDIMTTDVLWVGSDTTVREIATLLSEKNISAVPVVEHGEMLGMVSEADLIQRQELGTETSLSRHRIPGANVDYDKSRGMYARDVMTRNVLTVSELTPLAEIAEIMQSNHVKRVPVTRKDKLVGVVSRTDIVRTLAARPEGAQEPLCSDDDMIRFKVIETLMNMPGTSPWLTTVTVSNGVVELHGTVEDEAKRDPSRVAIANIRHVVDVKDHRRILQPY